MLNELSDEGRLKLSLFKKQIDQLENYNIMEKDGKERLALLEEVNNLKEQYTW